MSKIDNYRFNLNKLVNNLNRSKVNKSIKNSHKINKSLNEFALSQFYKENFNLMINLAEENISTVTDLNNYEIWIENVE